MAGLDPQPADRSADTAGSNDADGQLATADRLRECAPGLQRGGHRQCAADGEQAAAAGIERIIVTHRRLLACGVASYRSPACSLPTRQYRDSNCDQVTPWRVPILSDQWVRASETHARFFVTSSNGRALSLGGLPQSHQASFRIREQRERAHPRHLLLFDVDLAARRDDAFAIRGEV